MCLCVYAYLYNVSTRMLCHRKDLKSSLKTTASFAVAHAARVLASRWWLVKVLWLYIYICVCVYMRYARYTVMEAIGVERKDNAIYFSLYSSFFHFLSHPCASSCVPVDSYIARTFFSPFSFFCLSLFICSSFSSLS